MRLIEIEIIAAVLIVFFGWGCGSFLTPEFVEAMARDQASFCALADTRGGAGGIVGGMTGGYGQSSLYFCRSNQPNARIEMKPDGAISIEHGGGGVTVPTDPLYVEPRAPGYSNIIPQKSTVPATPILLLVR